MHLLSLTENTCSVQAFQNIVSMEHVIQWNICRSFCVHVFVVYLNSASKRRDKDNDKIRRALLWQLNGFHNCTVVRNRCHIQGLSRTAVT